MLCTVLLAAAGLAGCQRTAAPESDFFMAESAARDIDRFCAAQAAAGAKQDATLTTSHFDGQQLNSLGRAKLHLMLSARAEGQRLDVYADLPADDDLQARRASITDCIAKAGIDQSAIQIRSGANPNAYHLAAPELLRLPKTESNPQTETATSSSRADTAGTK